MPSYIIKLTDPRDGRNWYMEWSTVVDAPTTYGMPLTEFEEYYGEQYGVSGMVAYPHRMARVEANGTSGHVGTLDGLLDCNRAGRNEAHIGLTDLIDRYCKEQEVPL